MEKIKKVFGVFVLAFCFALTVKTNSQAADKLYGIKQIDADHNSVTVSVNQNLQTKYYAIEVRDAGSNEWRQIGKSVSADCLKTQSLLDPGKSYYLRVRGFSDFYCKDETAGYSDELEVVTSPDITKMKVSETKATTGSFTVKYSGVKGANCFYLICDGETIGTSPKSTVKTSKKLSASKSYSVKAYASRKSVSGYIAEGQYSKGRFKEYTFKTVSKAISNKYFGVLDGSGKKNSYVFGIVKLPVCNGAQLQFATPSGKVKKNIYGNSRFTVKGFINNNFYKYRVRTYVKCGSSKIYSAWSDYNYIGVSGKAKGTFITKSKSIKLEWSKINNASGYDIYISDNENSGYKKVKSLSANKRSITITKYGNTRLKSSKRYYVKLVSKAKIGKKTVVSGTCHILKSNY